MSRWWCATVVVLGVVACGPRTMLQGDVHAVAARDLQCPRDQIAISDLEKKQAHLMEAAGGPIHAYARGCGKRMVYAHMCHADGSSCDWYSVKQLRIDQLISRVNYETQCDKSKISATQIAPNNVGVDACGARLTYLWSCPHNQDLYSPACSWVLNSETKRSTPPPTP